MGSTQPISGMPERIHSMCVNNVVRKFTSNSGIGVVLFFLLYKNCIFVLVIVKGSDTYSLKDN